jgi:polar amino acid transport system substrate-binding protein
MAHLYEKQDFMSNMWQFYTLNWKTLATLVGIFSAHGFFTAPQASAQSAANPSTSLVPMFWRLEPKSEAPNFKDLPLLRIVTADDYPPFNYKDGSGNLTGFNVELMQAICVTLRIQCTFVTGSYGQLFAALENGEADVAAAAIARTQGNFQRVDFSKPYYRSGGRFAVRVQNPSTTPEPREFAGRRLGVIKGTAFEAYLNAYFSRSTIRAFESHVEATEALRTGKIDAYFGDNLALTFWIQGEASRDCCKLMPGAFWESYFFGNGAGLATKRGDKRTMALINYGLDRIKISGAYDAVFRKYFPLPLE